MWLEDGRVRKLRRSAADPGCAHEFTFSCYHRVPLLGRDRTRAWFVEALARARRALQLELWAYVIMPEHVHVLLVPLKDDYQPSAVLQSIKQPVAPTALAHVRKHHPTWLDRLRDKSGAAHFWQPGGGYDRNVVDSATAWQMIEYIHLNPVRRGLVERPTDWAWSSARWYDGEGDVVLDMDAVPPH